MDEYIRKQDLINDIDGFDMNTYGLDFAGRKAYLSNTGIRYTMTKEEVKDLISKQPAVNHICGYDIVYLITFAMACRRAGVENEDLKEFADSCRIKGWMI